MDRKGTGRKTGAKIGFGILFVIACFVAMYILTEFHGDIIMVSIAALLLLISAFLFLNAVFSDKAKQLASLEEEEEVPEAIVNGGDGEFRLRIVKHMKQMESTQKELISVLKNQNALMKSQMENMAHEIYMLSEKQENQAKAIIKFNKENARQLAISERETLEYVMLELKKAIEDNSVPVSVAAAPAPVVAAEPILEEVEEAELFAVADFAADEDFVMPEMPASEEIPDLVEDTAPAEEVLEDLFAAEGPAEEEITAEIEIPEVPEDIDFSALFDMPELADDAVEEVSEDIPVEEIPADFPTDFLAEEAPAEEIPAVEEKAEEPAPAPVADPLAGLSADPNAMMSPEDIAKLLEAMGQ